MALSESFNDEKSYYLDLIDEKNENFSLGEIVKHNSIALSKAVRQNHIEIIVPVGTFPVDNGFELNTNLFIRGVSKNRSIIKFYPAKESENYLFHITENSNLIISNLTIINLGSKSVLDSKLNRYVPLTQRKANTSTIFLEAITKGEINNCEFIGGHFGIEIANSNKSKKGIILIKNNTFKNQACTAIVTKDSHFINIENNIFLFSGVDGLKTRGKSSNLMILNNRANKCGRDGYDFFDGLIASTVSNNVSTGNFYNGFDMKGNPDSSGEFVFKDNMFTGNTASENGFYGFSLQNVRNVTMEGNSALLNNKSGFLFNNVQNSVFNALNASKNRDHGFLFKEISRSVISNCIAMDNNFGRKNFINNEIYFSGFYFEMKAGGLIINSCLASNGTTKKTIGNQMYGAFFEQGSVNNKFANCDFRNNKKVSFKGFGGNFKDQKIN